MSFPNQTTSNSDLNRIDRPKTPRNPINNDRSLLKQRREKSQKPVFIESFEDVDFMCDICDFVMLKVDKGEHAGHYVCRKCGMKVNPKEDYLKHPSQIRTATDEEGSINDTPFVQVDDDPRMKPKQYSQYDVLDEAEQDLRHQLYSKGYQLVKVIDQTSEATQGPGVDFNKVQRPSKFKPTEEENLL